MTSFLELSDHDSGHIQYWQHCMKKIVKSYHQRTVYTVSMLSVLGTRYRTPHRKTTRRMRQLIESQLIESKTHRQDTSTKDNSWTTTTHRYKLK